MVPGLLQFQDSWVMSTVLQFLNDSTKGPIYLVYFSILGALVSAWVAAGFVAVMGINFAYLELFTEGESGNDT